MVLCGSIDFVTYDVYFCCCCHFVMGYLYVVCTNIYYTYICIHSKNTGDSPSSSQPTTMRQTNVVVIPNANELQSFYNFDKLVMAINQARRSARDFVLKKKDDDDGKEWT